MNFEEIKARLQNGESLETIAQEMENMLNQANAFVQEEKVKSGKRDEAYAHKGDEPDLCRIDHDGCIGQDKKSCHNKHQHT